MKIGSQLSLRKSHSTHTLILLWLFLVNGVANFFYFKKFGFYDDDWGMIAPAWSYTPLETVHMALTNAAQFRLGRPLQFLFTYFFAGFAALVPQFWFPYVLVFLLSCLVVALLYRTLLEKFPRDFCALVSLIFILSPLTTLRAYINANSYKTFAFLLVFSAILTFRKHRAWSYLLAFLCLLTHESIFFLFVGAPLLSRGPWKKRNRLGTLLHFTGCVALLAIYAYLRVFLTEQRAVVASGHIGWKELAEIFSATLEHSLFSFRYYPYAWGQALQETKFGVLGFSVLITLPWLYLSRRKIWGAPQSMHLQKAKWWGLQGIAAGSIFLFLGYILIHFETLQASLHFAGRTTRYSVAATFGSSLVAAAIIYFLFSALSSRITRAIAASSAFLLLLGLFVYSFKIQEDYIEAWNFQRTTMKRIMALTPQLQKNSTIFIITEGASSFLPVISQPRDASIGYESFGFELTPGAMKPDLGIRYVFLEEEEFKKQLDLSQDGKLRWRQGEAEEWRIQLMGVWPYEAASAIALRMDMKGNLSAYSEKMPWEEKNSFAAPLPAKNSAWAEFESSTLFRQML